MSSSISFVFIALLIFASSAHTARQEPADPTKTILPQDVKEEMTEMVEGSKEVTGEEEWLQRRTMAAHADYIYTQEHH